MGFETTPSKEGRPISSRVQGRIQGVFGVKIKIFSIWPRVFKKKNPKTPLNFLDTTLVTNHSITQ